jgi:hypothetical protein
MITDPANLYDILDNAIRQTETRPRWRRPRWIVTADVPTIYVGDRGWNGKPRADGVYHYTRRQARQIRKVLLRSLPQMYGESVARLLTGAGPDLL